MRQTLLGFLVAGLLAGAAEARKDADKKDEEKIQGTWILMSIEVDGQPVPEEKAKELTMILADGKATIKEALGGPKEQELTYKLDSAKDPREITFTRENDTMLGIYTLVDDTLTLCLARKGKERPTEFASKAETKTVLIVLKREKK